MTFIGTIDNKDWNFRVGKLVRFGKLPVDFKLQGFWNAEKPKGAADWALQFQVNFLFPK